MDGPRIPSLRSFQMTWFFPGHQKPSGSPVVVRRPENHGRDSLTLHVKQKQCLFGSSYVSKAWLVVFLTQTNHNSLSILFWKGEKAKLVTVKVPWVSMSVLACACLCGIPSEGNIGVFTALGPRSCLSLPFPRILWLKMLAHLSAAHPREGGF